MTFVSHAGSWADRELSLYVNTNISKVMPDYKLSIEELLTFVSDENAHLVKRFRQIRFVVIPVGGLRVEALVGVHVQVVVGVAVLKNRSNFGGLQVRNFDRYSARQNRTERFRLESSTKSCSELIVSCSSSYEPVVDLVVEIG